jgi:hypothetical protein
MKNNVDEVRKFLTEDGWHHYASGNGMQSEYWCKRWKDAPRCSCNYDKEGVQVVLNFYWLVDRYSYSIEVRGEKPDGMWVCLEVYGIGEDEIIKVLNAQSDQLVAAWTSMVVACKH